MKPSLYGLPLALVLLSGCASSSLTDARGNLRQFTRDDLQRGVEIARAANDPAGEACGMALLARLPEELPARLSPVGAYSSLMTVRKLRRSKEQGVDEVVHIACAPVVLDSLETIARLGLAVTPGGGIADRVLGR